VSSTGPEPVELGRQVNVHDAVGGEAFFTELVDRFYDGVAGDALLRPLYPEDLTESRHHMVLFLRQYWGGPGTYSAERGHPRLRMRHAPFAIGEAERDAWLGHMLAALDATAAAHDVAEELVPPIRQHLLQAADFLVNTR
jgi:hemoglobin